MNKLSDEAYAIIEDRHSDPFRYLGLHKEGDKTVARAFLPACPRSVLSTHVFADGSRFGAPIRSTLPAP